MTDDLGARIQHYYESAAPPVDPEEAIARHVVRVEAAPRRRKPFGWSGKNPLAVVGTAAVATLLLVGGALLAVQGESHETVLIAGTVEVSGESSCVIDRYGTWTGDPLPGDFTTHQRGQTMTCTDETSDVRINGPWTVTVNCNYSTQGGVTVGECWGTLERSGDQGGWEGRYTARTQWSAEAPEIFHVIDGDVLGSGEYTGLRYIPRYEGTLASLAITGRIGQIEAFDEGAGTTTAGP